MRGNSAIIKCLIPSFVADFVQVTAWINDEGDEILPQNEFNGGKMKKKHPSFKVQSPLILKIYLEIDEFFNLILNIISELNFIFFFNFLKPLSLQLR